MAGTIVYVFTLLVLETNNLERKNNSITGSTVKVIIIQAEHNNPELVGSWQILLAFG